jgi:hypothetical protein
MAAVARYFAIATAAAAGSSPTMYLLFVVHVVMVSAGIVYHLLVTRIDDALIGCVLVPAGTLAATHPRAAPMSG